MKGIHEPKIDKDGLCDYNCIGIDSNCKYWDISRSLHESGSEGTCCTYSETLKMYKYMESIMREKLAKSKEGEISICVENGCFTVGELKKLIQCIREIEQNNADRIIKITMNTPEKTVEEIKDVINSAKPGFPHQMILERPKFSDDDSTKF